MIAVGGGGIPVIADFAGKLRGVSAVVCQELAASVLASQLDADRLVLLAAEPPSRAYTSSYELRTLTVAEARGRKPGVGPMWARLESACRFVESTGNPASIGPIHDDRAVLDGDAGTMVVPERSRDCR